ncbi:membrane bound O-acyl transferase family-domain-containing protein [Hysterangium stoloniferum]|nr:membrane bound O-acyl transferase family-domain-containing protein [Hysterangium stoloniferum]
MNYARRIFRSLIPRPEDRIPFNAETWPNYLFLIVPILPMAYLARRPNTHVLRLLMFPITVVTALRAGFCFVWLDPRYNTYNFGAGLFALFIIARALEYAFTPEGIMKIDEARPGERTTAAIATGLKSQNGSPDTNLTHRSLNPFLPTFLSDPIELLFSMRGIGFHYGRGTFIPPETRPLEKGPFLRATLWRFIISFLTIDFLDSILKLTPPLQSPLGGSIFIPELSLPERYIVSTLIHIGTGCSIVAGFEMVYSLLTLFSVGVLSHCPTAWPPVFHHPWSAQSLHEFWSHRWHQHFRRIFMIYGGLPGMWLGQRLGFRKALGALYGAFLASGLFHELASYAMGKGLDRRVPVFFLLHANLMLGERIWRNVTGRHVGGWLGTIWVYFTIIVLGQNMTDSWHQRGLGGGMVIPPLISPTRQILFPICVRLMALL